MSMISNEEDRELALLEALKREYNLTDTDEVIVLALRLLSIEASLGPLYFYENDELKELRIG